LKIISSALGDANGTLEQKLISICQLLSTAAVSSPVEIQSFTIQFNVQVDPETDFRHAHSIPSWLDLDDILTGNPFANLRQVDLDFHFFIFSASTAPADWQPRIDIHILPRLSTHPFINFRLNIQKIYTPHPMAVQLYFL
jgi:hypothetical protein